MALDPINWFWFVNEEGKLCLSLADDIEFESMFSQQQLVEFESGSIPFTTDDAQTYCAYRDTLRGTALDEQQQFSTAINAVVACHYLAALPTKSWYFTKASKFSNELFGGDLVVTTAATFGYYVVIESEQNTSTIMLLSKRQQVDETRFFERYHTLKVHNDRLTKIQRLPEDFV